MATIKKSAKKYATGGTVTTETTKPVKKTFKSNPDSGGVAPFTDKEQIERRKRLNLPTSDKEKKAYYKKMSEEGARSGKTMKKAQGGGSLGMKSVKSGYDNNSGVTRADFVSIGKGKGKAKSGAKMKSGGKMKTCKGGC